MNVKIKDSVLKHFLYSCIMYNVYTDTDQFIRINRQTDKQTDRQTVLLPIYMVHAFYRGVRGLLFRGGGTICARKREKKIWAPPLKNPFLEKNIDIILKKNFAPPSNLDLFSSP